MTATSGPILADELFEGDESFFLKLDDPRGQTVLTTPSTTEILVVEDDFAPPGAGPEPAGPAFGVDGAGPGQRLEPVMAYAAAGGARPARDPGGPGPGTSRGLTLSS